MYLEVRKDLQRRRRRLLACKQTDKRVFDYLLKSKPGKPSEIAVGTYSHHSTHKNSLNQMTKQCANDSEVISDTRLTERKLTYWDKLTHSIKKLNFCINFRK